MSKKQFDHIENRIREAAENSQPAFDELAWSRLEDKLNKADNKRWRILVGWLTLTAIFIASGSIYFFIIHKPDNKITGQHQNVIEKKPALQENPPAVTSAITRNLTDSNKKLDINNENASPKHSGGEPVFHNNKDEKSSVESLLSPNKQGLEKRKVTSGIIPGVTEGGDDKYSGADTVAIISKVPSVNNLDIDTKKIGLMDTRKISDSSVNTIAKELLAKNSFDKKNELKPSRFYFLASIGADAPNVKPLSFDNVQITARYGVGIGYQLTRKVSLQTGFYAGSKKYIAGPEDYNTNYGGYWSTVKMVKVDGNCLVYDIPLTVSYNLLQKEKVGYYISAGLSSYIMKNETYNYYYLRNNIPHEATRSYTGNRNLFSVFNLAAGIEKKLSTNFFLRVEPSFSIPMAGVGEGSVKLYSTALQLAIKYQPAKR